MVGKTSILKKSLKKLFFIPTSFFRKNVFDKSKSFFAPFHQKRNPRFYF